MASKRQAPEDSGDGTFEFRLSCVLLGIVILLLAAHCCKAATLSCNPNPEEDVNRYLWYRVTPIGLAWIGTTPTPLFVWPDAVYGDRFRVKAANAQESPFSEEFVYQPKPPPTLPPPPQPVKVTLQQGSDLTSWRDVATHYFPATTSEFFRLKIETP